MTATQFAALTLIADAGPQGLPMTRPGTSDSPSIHGTVSWRLQGHLHRGAKGPAYIEPCKENGVYLWRLTDEGRALLGK